MKRNLLPVLIAMVWVASCGRSDKSNIAVPKDAAVVVQVNAKSLSSKLTWQEIKQSEWYKELYSQAPDSLAKKLMEDPQSSGIDTDADIVFFMRKLGEGGYVVFEGTLKDPATYEAFNKNISKQATVQKDGDLNILKSENTVSTWTTTRFIYVIDAPDMKSGRRYYGSDDDNGPRKLSTDTLQALAKELYDLKNSNNLTDDKRFTALLKEEGDVHSWINSSSFYGDALGNALSVTKFSDMLKDNISTFTINFENGKVVAKSKSYYNAELAKIFDKYKVKDLDASALARIASDNVAGALAFNFPPEGIKEFLKVAGFDGMVNGFLGKEGYSIDEFVKANKGDLILAVTDPKVNAVQDTLESFDQGGKPHIYTHNKLDVNVLFAVSVNDKASFDKLINILRTKFEKDVESGQGMPKISYAINDKWFAIGNNKDLVDKFIAGNGSKQDYVSRISGHPMGAYLDIQKVLKTSAAMSNDSLDRAPINLSLQYLNDGIMYGSLGNGEGNGYYELNFIDKQTNSLKQLNQYSDKLHTIYKSRKQAYDISTDSVAVVAPSAPQPSK